MRIGTITFHWVTNYGAVLQAYALQQHLLSLGHNVEIIDYKPFTIKKTFFRAFLSKNPKTVYKNILDFYKEKRFKEFRNQYLKTSSHYTSYQNLQNSPPLYDVYICGSDQIWNPTFSHSGENQLTLSYFLDFGTATKISYAASLGCTVYPNNVMAEILPALKNLDHISVRENSGQRILNEVGISNVSVVPDPTLLLKYSDYDKLIEGYEPKQSNFYFFYTLHKNQKLTGRIKIFLGNTLGHNVEDSLDFSNSLMNIEEWLTNIKYSKGVVTNSFHGMVFSIIYQKPFIVVPVEGSMSGMNDRIHTLLQNLGLENRLVTEYDSKVIESLMIIPIDWVSIERKVELLRNNGRDFLNISLNN